MLLCHTCFKFCHASIVSENYLQPSKKKYTYSESSLSGLSKPPVMSPIADYSKLPCIHSSWIWAFGIADYSKLPRQSNIPWGIPRECPHTMPLDHHVLCCCCSCSCALLLMLAHVLCCSCARAAGLGVFVPISKPIELLQKMYYAVTKDFLYTDTVLELLLHAWYCTLCSIHIFNSGLEIIGHFPTNDLLLLRHICTDSLANSSLHLELYQLYLL